MKLLNFTKTRGIATSCEDLFWLTFLGTQYQIRSYDGHILALRDDQVLPSATTVSIICWREYALTVDAIKKQMPSQNKVSLALDGWTSTNKLAIMSVIAYYMDRYCALCDVQLAFNKFDRLFISLFER